MTAKSRMKAKIRKRVVSDTYGLEIVLKIGDTMRSKGIVKKTDVLTQSEGKDRKKSKQLDALVDSGFVLYVEEDKHQHQVRHLDLTEDGWTIWKTFDGLKDTVPEKKTVWSDAEQSYIEVD